VPGKGTAIRLEIPEIVTLLSAAPMDAARVSP